MEAELTYILGNGMDKSQLREFYQQYSKWFFLFRKHVWNFNNLQIVAKTQSLPISNWQKQVIIMYYKVSDISYYKVHRDTAPIIALGTRKCFLEEVSSTLSVYLKEKQELVR